MSKTGQTGGKPCIKAAASAVCFTFMDALSFSAKNAGLLPVHFTMWGEKWRIENKTAFLQIERNQTGVFGVLPIAVRQLSISPFISRSMALATSTLLYLEYLSNTDRGPGVTCG